MTHLIGQSLGRYHILEQLGEGGMATVYKAYDTRLERNVAVKVIRKSAFGSEVIERILKRFDREAKALARLNHPNIVPVIDYGEYVGAPYLVMPYLSGGTLKLQLGEPKPWREAVRTLLPIAQALEYAHRQGVIHRDVKPSNILITDSGQPMLTDFGIAKILEGDEAETLTGTGMGMGTPEYMAPEQWTGGANQQADQYSLGVVLYEMLTGRKPYVADTPAALLLKHVNDPLPSPNTLIPGIPEKVERVLQTALAKDAGMRYPSMGELAKALENLLGGEEGGELEKPTGQGKARPKQRAVVGFPKWGAWAISAFVGIGILAGFLALGGPARISQSFEKSTPTTTEFPTHTTTSTPSPTPEQTPTPEPTATPELGIGSTRTRSVDGMTLVYVPEAEFIMGSGITERSIYLDSFWIDQTEVTNAMFQKFVEATGYITDAEKTGSAEAWSGTDIRPVNGANWMHPQGPESDLTGLEDHPVVLVSWNDAFAYCQWAGARLPTEAEWEMTARGTEGRAYPWGNREPMNNLLNFADLSLGAYTYWIPKDEFDDGWAFTSPVGSYPEGASPYGAFDMVGNVWEWVQDWYDEYIHNSPITENPTGPETGTKKVIRGGSWYNSRISDQFLASSRFPDLPDSAFSHMGFRCAGDGLP